MMGDRSEPASGLRHRQVEVEGLSIHVVEGGAPESPAVLFLHGWPENWTAFETVMGLLEARAHVFAIDLPGIGASEPAPPAGDKHLLAKYVRGLVWKLGLDKPTLVGHDVGGQIVYAYLHAFPQDLERAVILDVAIPGVDPWDAVVRNPRIWHFAFHAIPDLPERLVAGKQAAYFDYFYDAIAARPEAIPCAVRERYVQAYARPEALKAGFDWYRAFPQDEKDNQNTSEEKIKTPVLYLRGDREPGDLEDYLKGLRESGLRRLYGGLIPNSGHFSPDEQPEEVVLAIQAFLDQ